MNTDREALWVNLLRQEFHARTQLGNKLNNGTSKNQLRAWWGTVAEVLMEYAKRVAGGSAPETPMAEMAIVLAHLARDLAAGVVPDPIKDVATRGRTKPGSFEARDLRMAVAYHRACSPPGLLHRGEYIKLDDPAPVQRIHLWYDWLERYEPAFLGENRINEDVIINEPVAAGERYRAAGRSQQATRKRDLKRG